VVSVKGWLGMAPWAHLENAADSEQQPAGKKGQRNLQPAIGVKSNGKSCLLSQCG